MELNNPKVIVLSRNYSTGLGVIRSLGEAGYSVDLVASVKKSGSSIIASSSKYVESSVEVLSKKIQGDLGDELIDVLMEYPQRYNEKLVLFPTDDFTTSVVDRNRKSLEEYFFMPKTNREFSSIESLMDKTFQGELAKSVGILTPLEWKISLQAEIQVPDDVVYPCFVKPLQSISGHKTEMSVCNDEDELKRHLLKMKDFYSDREVLVQEFLNIEKEYDLSGICIDNDIVIPGVIEKTRIAAYERGVTMSGKMVSLDILGDYKTKILEMLKKLRYIGMFDMELNLCGDKLYFNEINLRSGGPNFFYLLNGVNLPDLFVQEIAGFSNSIKPTRNLSLGKTFVYEKVAWEDYIHGYMTKKELKNCLSEADYTLLAYKDDPNPGRHFAIRIRLSAIKQRIKKVIK